MGVLVTPLVFGGETFRSTALYLQDRQDMQKGKTFVQHKHREEAFILFVLPGGEFEVEVPKTWKQQGDPLLPNQETYFVGPIDFTKGTVVFLTIGQYPNQDLGSILEQERVRLLRNRSVRVLADTDIFVNPYRGRLITIEEQGTLLLATLEIVPYHLIQSVLHIPHGQTPFLFTYVASPQLYDHYRSFFDHVLATLRVHGSGIN